MSVAEAVVAVGLECVIQPVMARGVCCRSVLLSNARAHGAWGSWARIITHGPAGRRTTNRRVHE